VEYAKRNHVSAGDLPVHGWTETADVVHAERAEEALSFIFRELPLTYDEKADLLYCASNSSLKDVASGVRIRRNRRREVVAA
jgi:hypothetical protein